MSAPGDRDHVQLYNHYADVLNQLAQFHDAHILSGHSHRWCNYLHKSYLCKSGRPVYEHNQNAVGGWCWLYGYMCPDGSPQGYCIYDVRGNEVYDWVAKTTLKDADYQMRVYNGNQVFTDANSTKYSWTDTYLYPKYAKADFKNSFIVSLWGGDDTHWTLDLYINGTKYGTLTKVYTIDMCAQDSRQCGPHNGDELGNTRYSDRAFIRQRKAYIQVFRIADRLFRLCSRHVVKRGWYTADWGV